VSKSGYYQWLRQADEKQKDHDDYLLVKEIFDKGKGKYGWRQVKMQLLRQKQIVMNHKKVIRIMRKYQLVAKIRQRNPYKSIMKKTQEHNTFENKLDRQFKPARPYQIFCTDITYIPFNSRFAYLSVVKDIASGEVVAWHLLPYITMPLVLETLAKLKTGQSTMIHSDQGFHYTNPQYIAKVKALEMVQSMSRKGNCIDNAPIESFFGHMKDEVDYKNCKTFGQLYQLIENYIRYYNYERAQWDRNKMTPVEYRSHLLAVAV
jgi:transposase InsO family protein